MPRAPRPPYNATFHPRAPGARLAALILTLAGLAGLVAGFAAITR